MSLHKAALHLATKGRGPDTMLVHMAPGEVAGLQALAKTAGGSLSLNPDTGLPEAGFLSNLLPTIIGAGVTAFTGGAAAPWMVGAGVGGLQALRTGSLTKGLTAGLGAYGGAGLTGGLADMGATALARGAGAAIPQTTVDEYGRTVANPEYAAGPTPSYGDRLRAGAGTFEWNKPMDFVRGIGGGDSKRGAMMIGAAALPTVMDVLTPQQSTRSGGNDSTMPQRMRYDTATGRYVPISQQAAKNMYGFADGGITGGGMPVWNPKWVPDTPGYGNQGRNFGREILYYDPVAAEVPEEAAATDELPYVPPEVGGAGGQDFGQDSGGGRSSLNFDESNNYTGIPAALFGKTLAEILDTPVVDLSAYNVENVDYGPNAMDYGPGKLSSIGAGIAANPMGMDPAQRGAIAAAVEAQALADMADRAPVDYGPTAVDSNAFGGAPAQADQAGDRAPVDYGGSRQVGQGDNNAPSGTSDGGGGGGGGAGPSTSDDRDTTDYGGGVAAGGMIGRYAAGGISSLGGYSDGGRLLRGPGDGVSDSIPATIGHKRQPARLADGEFVVPARIVSELGNGSTEAGARKLYAMMDRIQANRKKSVGRGRVAVNAKSDRHLPA